MTDKQSTARSEGMKKKKKLGAEEAEIADT